MTQPFLHTGEHRPIVACLQVDHSVRGQAGLSKCRREKIGPRDAPEGFAGGACGYTGRE